MLLNTYQELFREHFDISDDATRKCIVNLEDGEQEQLLTALSSKLYDMIVDKVDQIDFGSIPKSRGDITKVDSIENTEECLSIIRQLVMEYKEDPECVDTVITAIQNIKDRKALFVKSFSLNVELPIILYNTTVLAIEQSVSFLIAVCIAYIKDPDTQSMNAALDKAAYNNAKDNLMFRQLYTFNASCASKELESTIEEIIKNGNAVRECGEGYGSDYTPVPVPAPEPEYPSSEVPEDDTAAGGQVSSQYEPINGSNEERIKPDDQLQEFSPVTIGLAASAVVGGIALGLKAIKALSKVIIPYLRNLVYMFINKRTKLADDLAVQAQFIEANAYKLQYSTNSGLSDEKKAKVIAKQNKIAKQLMSLSNKFAVKNKQAEMSARKMAMKDTQKFKIDDLKGDISPEIYDKSVLF